jgi:hypothetical protein
MQCNSKNDFKIQKAIKSNEYQNQFFIDSANIIKVKINQMISARNH